MSKELPAPNKEVNCLVCDKWLTGWAEMKNHYTWHKLEHLAAGNDLLTEDSKPPQSFTEAQIRDFFLTTYTEYQLQSFDIKHENMAIQKPATFDGYINYLRNKK